MLNGVALMWFMTFDTSISHTLIDRDGLTLFVTPNATMSHGV